MKLSEIVSYYNDIFVPAYAYAVAELGDKPQQLLIEVENCNAHIMQGLSHDEGTAEYTENMKSAKRHLQRGALDSYKLIWVHLVENVERLLKGVDASSEMFIHSSYYDLYMAYRDFVDEIEPVRRDEHSGVGKSTDDTIAAYKQAVDNAADLLKKVQKELPKIDHLRRYIWKQRIKENWVGYIVSGLVGAVISAGAMAVFG